jgi:photosystem II stability/assembly factor-like uncharacterized protein
MKQRILAATRKGLFAIERGRAGWSVDRVAFLGDNATMVLPDARDGSVYVSLGHGHWGVKLHRSPDGGRTWEEIAAPGLPPRPEGDAPRKDPMGRVIPDNVQLVWSLEAADPRGPGSLWCGTIPGGLFHSRDAGRSWDLVRGLWDHPKRLEWMGGGADWPGIHSICVDPTDAQRVAVGVSTGGVWATTDGGATWKVSSHGMRAAYMPPEQQHDPHVQDVHRLVQCPGHPASWWVQHHNGVFRSTDGAASWQEVEVPPSSFGFAVAVHPKEPNTAWFVPGISDERRIPVDGRVVVTRTRDGGKTFDVLKTGLPQTHAYDLTFRHCLDIDATGDRLAFGTTTGSLWVTEDQGDTWQVVSEHLPPVYCVRFAAR